LVESWVIDKLQLAASYHVLALTLEREIILLFLLTLLFLTLHSAKVSALLAEVGATRVVWDLLQFFSLHERVCAEFFHHE